MTDLKKVSASKDGVAYLWTSQRGKKAGRRPAAARKKKEPDPMFVPWGDIVEMPMRFLRRLFDRG